MRKLRHRMAQRRFLCLLTCMIGQCTSALQSSRSVLSSLAFTAVTVTLPDQDVNSTYLSINYEQECQDKFTDYVYQRKVCGANTQEEFWENFKTRYSCAGRCGNAEKYRKLDDCACDSVCVVYGDCCSDFAAICNDTKARGEDLYSHLLGISTKCIDSTFPVLYQQVDSQVTSAPFSSTSPLTTPGKNNPLIAIEDYPLPYAPRTLIRYCNGLSMNKVVDVISGIAFNNLVAFNKWKNAGMEPAFVPIISTLDCSASTIRTFDSVTSAQIFPWCRFHKASYATGASQRKCQRPKIVICKCNIGDGPSQMIKDYRRDACVGERNPVSLFSRYEMLSHFYKSLPTPEIERGECFIRGTGPYYDIDYMYDTESKDLDPRTSITMTISRKFQSPESTKHDEYVVELTNTLEKKFRCPSRTSVLSNCQLEECATGAIQWTSPSPQPQWEFHKASCFLPGTARVRPAGDPVAVMPLCTCMRVLTAMSSLLIWDVKKQNYPQGRTDCLLSLAALKQG